MAKPMSRTGGNAVIDSTHHPRPGEQSQRRLREGLEANLRALQLDAEIAAEQRFDALRRFRQSSERRTA